MQHKRKKKSRMKGRETHGHGSSKKRRGAGHRGGKGQAGSGKRGSAKNMKVTQGVPNFFGKHGFHSHSRTKVSAINVLEIQNSLVSLVSKGLAKKEKDIYVLDIKDLGCNKLLAKGPVTSKLRITAESATQNAVDLVKKAGGEVITPTGAQTSEKKQ
jgi:large subunit ribosomal protein L15